MGRERVKIEGDEIVIRVPIAAIPHAADIAWSDDAPDGESPLVVTDARLFAKEIVTSLLSESEDGTTAIDLMLDKAVLDATERGAEGIEEVAPLTSPPDP